MSSKRHKGLTQAMIEVLRRVRRGDDLNDYDGYCAAESRVKEIENRIGQLWDEKENGLDPIVWERSNELLNIALESARQDAKKHGMPPMFITFEALKARGLLDVRMYAQGGRVLVEAELTSLGLKMLLATADVQLDSWRGV